MKYLSPFETYKIYTALKLHFTGDYDAQRYNFSTNVTMKAFDKRKDKYHFAKIGKLQQSEEKVIQYIISNLSEDPKRWVGSFNDASHRKRIGRIEALQHIYEKDLYRLSRSGPLLRALLPSDNEFPLILEELQQEKISLETVAILQKLTNFLSKIEVPDTLWEDTKKRIVKYEQFISYDRKKFEEIAKSLGK